MRHVILAGLRARRTRLLLTSAAVALGVAFVVATVAMTDTLAAQLYDTTARQARDVAVRVTADGSGRLTDADLAAVRGVPGVAAAAGRAGSTGVLLGADGRVVTSLGNPDSTLRALADDPRLAGFDLAAGAYPTGPGEIVVDRDTAAAQGWPPGATVRLVTTAGETVAFRLAGTADTTGSWPVVHLPAADLTAVTGESGWGAVDVLAGPGAAQDDLRDAVADALAGRPVRVVTGARYADALASAAVGDVAQIRLALGAFALVALLVAALVIHNTFAILVAQRQRELALLRCVGAGRGQVFRTVLAEAAVLGVLASLIGFGLGLGLGWLGAAALGRTSGVGLDVPLQVGANTVAVALLVGVGITVGSAALPARGATRVAPVTALANQPDLAPTGNAGVLRVVTGTAALLLGTALVVAGAVSAAIVPTVAGGVPVALGVLALGPVVVGPLARLVGRIPALLFGVAGRLAARSGDRSPRRAAATALSLTVGITLVTAFLVSAETLKHSLDDQMRKRFPLDYLVTAPDGHRLPGDLADRLAAVPEVGRAVPLAATGSGLRAGTRTGSAEVGGFDPDLLRQEFALPVGSGAVGDFAAGGAVLDPATAETLAVRAGDRITVEGPDGSVDVVVSAVLSAPSAPLPAVLLTPAEAAAVVGTPDPHGVLVWMSDSVPAAAARTAVASVTDTEPLAVVTDVQSSGDQTGAIIDGLLAVVGALVVLSVVIAVAGIANTLTLSVLERTREFGLLRAVGLGRRQLRVMLLAEGAVLATVAGVVGVAFGVGFGVAAAYAAIPRDWLVLVLPYGRIALVVVGAAVVGLLAGVLPARRAARVPPVAALAAD
ncbi:FtsX-like permease family protein [Polymorphospora rubra]|uniref:ABC transporter substrate-binding protein n=1 Tax=Polymorphospora rubra TaxID=338584 RepID=A0A810N048_9ACTN|nr:FtsX-like permease family protein [Polymorphospora rubra]BCJ66772.1 ABC transporter substrate-binding protein [Polymorphospora rubra]